MVQTGAAERAMVVKMNQESRVNLEVDLRKLAENVHEIRRRVAPAKLMAVLKANAYGLGVLPVAEVVRDAGAACFGVAEINEALELIPLGLPVQILGNLLPNEIAPAVEHGVVCPLNDLGMARKISAEAVRQNRTVHCAVTVDSGMGRLGMPAGNAAREILAMRGLPNLVFDSIYSHCSNAFLRHDDYTLGQLALFKALLAELAAEGMTFPDVHIAASDALNNFPESTKLPFTLARCGINLYGYYDPEVHPSMRLSPVVELKTKLAAVRTLAAGSSIGYGRMHRLLRDTRVGTIAAGYADGLPLALSNRGYVLVNGQLCPVLGRISMDYTTISLENAPEAQPGDEVVCVGTQGGQRITLDDWAQLKGTHAYDILCSIGTRVRRCYLR